MVVAVVLICVEFRLGLGGVVHASLLARGLPGQWRPRRNNGGSLREIQMNIALQANREAKIVPGWKYDNASSGSLRRADCRVYGGRIPIFFLSPPSLNPYV